MKRHRFNIFPEAKAEDYNRLLEDIRENGYDQAQPVTLYEGDILDGWNRQKACDELGITAPYTTFSGTASEAIALVMRTNKRRNLNSGQWAAVAAEADELLAVIREQVEKDRIEKQKANAANQYTEPALAQKIAPTQTKTEKETAHKAAELFNTNRTYVNQAVKMKQAAPEVFEKVKAGTMTMQDGMKAVRAIPTDPWIDDEKQRREEVEGGKAVVANQQRDKNLIQWAEAKGFAVYIGRGSIYGNPFIMDKDGTRDEVCQAYSNHYFPHKRSLHNEIDYLRGKVLICHCYPARCHGHFLLDLSNAPEE